MKTVKLLTEQSLSTKSKVDIWKLDTRRLGWGGQGGKGGQVCPQHDRIESFDFRPYPLNTLLNLPPLTSCEGVGDTFHAFESTLSSVWNSQSLFFFFFHLANSYPSCKTQLNVTSSWEPSQLSHAKLTAAFTFHICSGVSLLFPWGPSKGTSCV